MINVEQQQTEGWVVTEEGSEVVEKGSHEFLVFQAVPPEGLLQEEVKVKATLRVLLLTKFHVCTVSYGLSFFL